MAEPVIRILFLEDNTDAALSVSNLLAVGSDEFVIDHVTTVTACCEKLRNGLYDLLLLGPCQAGEKCLEIYGLVRADAENMPVIILAGEEDENAGIQFMGQGAQDYISINGLEYNRFKKALRYAMHRHRAGAEDRMNGRRNEILLAINNFKCSSSQELLDFALEKVLELTGSSIGYIYFYNQHTEQFTLNSWSKDVMGECRVVVPQSIYKLETTGIWGEVVRQGRAILVNDFSRPDPLKKGYPEGHVPLSRFLSIPVRDDEQIVAVVGVANKKAPYDQIDVLQLTLAMEGVWKILARFRLEAQIIKAGQEWTSTFDSITDSLSIIDRDQRIVRCNRATVRMLGRPYGEILGKHCFELFHGTGQPPADCPVLKAVISKKTETGIFRSGDRWLEVSVSPTETESGGFDKAVHVVRDITEKQNLLSSLLETNELFREFMRHSPIYTYIKEVEPHESRVILASDNFVEMVGDAGREMIGKSTRELFSAPFADKIIADDWNVISVGRVLQQEEELNGRYYSTIKFPIIQSSRKLVAGFTIDITERKVKEELFRKNQLLLKKSAEKARMGGWEIDLASRRLTWTEQLYCIHEVDREFQPTIENSLDFYSTESRPVISQALRRAMDTGEPFDLELTLISAGRSRKFVHIVGEAECKAGRPVKLSGTFQDITELKQSEESLRNMQAQLLQNEKLASVGQLAAGVAHEINNPVGFVFSNLCTMSKYAEKMKSYIRMLEDALQENNDAKLPDRIAQAKTSLKIDYISRDITELISESCDGVERVKKIVMDLKTFSRSDSSTVGWADINKCLDSTINIVWNEIKYVAELKRDYAVLPEISCNVQQINQVFMNLLVNAAHSIGHSGVKGGEIVVRTWCGPEDVYISISDNGCGIAREDLRRIFDAFYTTKEIGQGTGLGLSISGEIIRKHGGDISVESCLGEGSTFTVRLPVITPVESKGADE